MNSLTILVSVVAGITSIKKVIRYNKLLYEVDAKIDALLQHKRSFHRSRGPGKRTHIVVMVVVIAVVVVCGKGAKVLKTNLIAKAAENNEN